MGYSDSKRLNNNFGEIMIGIGVFLRPADTGFKSGDLNHLC